MLNDTGFLRASAEDFLAKNPAGRLNSSEKLSFEEILQMAHEVGVQKIELEMLYEELAQVRSELEKEIHHYSDFYDSAPLAFLTLTRRNSISKANLAASLMLGVDRSFLIGDYFGRFIAYEDFPAFNRLMGRVFKLREGGDITLRIINDHDVLNEPVDHPDTLLSKRPIVRLYSVVNDNGQECRVTLVPLFRPSGQESLNAVDEKLPTAQMNHEIWSLSLNLWTLLTPQGDSILLTAKEFELIRYLGSRKTDLVPRQDLLKHLAYPHNESGHLALDSLVYRIRKKINPFFAGNLIKNVRGIGYSLSFVIAFI